MGRLKKIALYASAVIVIIAAAGAIFRPDAEARVKKSEKPAKYIFVMIGDGMGATQVAAAESYLSYKEGKLGGEQLTFTQFPVLGLCTTYSADSNITDSAASGTAIATGNKTDNHSLGVAPDGTPLKSMAYTLHEKGYNVGIMSSVPVNHATPGAFYAHRKDRNDYYEISLEMPESGFEFFASTNPAGILLLGVLIVMVVCSASLVVSDKYSLKVKARAAMRFNALLVVACAGMFFVPSCTSTVFVLAAVPAAMLLPLMFVRMGVGFTETLYRLALLLAAANTAVMFFL